MPETTNGTRPFRHADHEREWTREEFLEVQDGSPQPLCLGL